MLVGTHTGEDDVIFLTTLEGIHTRHFKLLWREGGREGERDEAREWVEREMKAEGGKKREGEEKEGE